jgi:hypothetical protein
MLRVAFAPLLSKLVRGRGQLLLTGAIRTVGPRTAIALLRVMGMSHHTHFQRFRNVSNLATWSYLQVT